MSIYTVQGNPIKHNNKWLAPGGTPSSDLPSYDSTDAGKVLRVNSSGTGLDWDEDEGTPYTAGYGIDISNNEISVDTSVVATQSDLTDGLASKQDVLTAGQNITIQNNVISATGSLLQVQSDWTEADTSDPSYIQHKPATKPIVAGSGISITEGASNVTIAATGGGGGGTTYTAGNGINIDTNNEISVDTTVVATQSDLASYTPTASLATVATTGVYSDLSGTPTIPTVDQTYNASSTNAQSGVAVASAISTALGPVETALANL